MKKTWIVIALAAAFCSACADSNEDKPLCVDGQSTCMAGVRYTCKNEAFVVNACPANNTCDPVSGDCVPNTDNCVEGTKMCSPDSLQVQYCSGGMWKYTDCRSVGVCGLVNNEAICIPNSSGTGNRVCEPGAKRCGLNGRQVCNENGQWSDAFCSGAQTCYNGECVTCISGSKRCADNKKAQECQNGNWVDIACAGASVCNDGKCIDPNTCSKENAVRCGDGNTVQTCKGGTWISTMVCSAPGADRCVFGECVDSKVPQEGDACSDKDGVGVCSNNAAHVCYEGSISKDKCGTGETCVVYNGMPDCSTHCSKDGETRTECVALNGKHAQFEYTCHSVNGSLWWISEGGFYCKGGAACDPSGLVCGESSGSSNWEDCSTETCTMQDGTSLLCGQACVQYAGSSQAKAWCDDSGSVSCSEPSSGGSTGDYKVCDDSCQVDGGLTCAQYCKSKGSDVCFMDDEYLYCEDPNAGGSTGGYEDCSTVDCKMQDGTVIACGQACKQYGGSSEAKAWCDAKGNVSCEDPNAGGSTGGGEACNEDTYVESCKGQTVNYCYEGEVDTFECDATAPCKVSAAGIADCAVACTAAQANTTVEFYCMDYMGYKLAVPMVCQATKDGSYASFMDQDKFEQCKAGCNETKGCL